MDCNENKLRYIATLNQNYFSTTRRYFELKNPNKTWVVKEYNINPNSLPNSYKEYFSKCFVKEFYVMKSLKDKLPIVKVESIEKEEDEEYEYPIVYIKMEDFQQGDLKNWRKTFPGISAKILAELGLQMINIVQKVHENGYLHRDIKPDNFFLDSELRLVIADFENCIEKDSEEISAEFDLDINHYHIGSIYFRPPDLDKNYGTEWDIFSLGITLYHLLEGEFPYDPISNKLEDVLAELSKLQEEGLSLKSKKFDQMELDKDLVNFFECFINKCITCKEKRVKSENLGNFVEKVKILLIKKK